MYLGAARSTLNNHVSSLGDMLGECVDISELKYRTVRTVCLCSWHAAPLQVCQSNHFYRLKRIHAFKIYYSAFSTPGTYLGDLLTVPGRRETQLNLSQRHRISGRYRRWDALQGRMTRLLISSPVSFSPCSLDTTVRCSL